MGDTWHTQYGSLSYVFDPGIGGKNGTVIKKRLDKKKKRTMSFGAWKGGSQFHGLYACEYSNNKPNDTRVLMRDNE